MPGERDVERYLAEVRPAGPPPHLRSRILSRDRETPILPWMAAAAALLCAGLAFHGATSRHAAPVLEPAEGPSVEARVERIAPLLGPGGESRRIATFFAIADELAHEANQIQEGR